jgi:PST family polysaccharide transporter
MPLGGGIGELRRQLERPGVRKAVENTAWLTAERLVRLGVGFFVGVWVARFLGPDRFGLFNYALAFAALVGAGANLGTDGVVVRELVKRPERADAIMATATGLRLCGAAGAAALTAVAAAAVHRAEPMTLALVLVFAAATLFKPFDVVDLWAQARTEMRAVIWARNGAFLAGTAARIGVLVAGGSLVALAAVEPLAAALGAVLLVRVYARGRGGSGLAGWDGAEARELLRASWPMLLSSVAVMIYMRVDQVMIERLAGPDATRAVGLYSAALRLSEVWYFVPTAILTAVFPHIVQSKREGEAIYVARLARIFAVMSALALAIAIPMTFLAGPLTTFVFGASYAGAAPILAVHVWTTLFVFWGLVTEAWSLNEGLMRLSLYRTLAAAALNVGLNLVLIPRHGALGAAVATLVTQACAATLFNLASARTRPIVALQIRSLLFRGLLG